MAPVAEPLAPAEVPVSPAGEQSAGDPAEGEVTAVPGAAAAASLRSTQSTCTVVVTSLSESESDWLLLLRSDALGEEEETGPTPPDQLCDVIVLIVIGSTVAMVVLGLITRTEDKFPSSSSYVCDCSPPLGRA